MTGERNILNKKADIPGVDDDFSNRFVLVHGDQLTVSRIRSVQHEQRHARLHYDRRRWLLSVPARFHIQYNLLLAIVRTHWKPIGSETVTHCVWIDATMWNRSQSSRDNVKYHLMEPIIAPGFTARIAVLFYSSMQQKGFLRSDYTIDPRKEVLDAAVAALNP